MIDCHAHAYPAAGTQLERVADHLVPGRGAQLTRAATGVGALAKAGLSSVLSRKLPRVKRPTVPPALGIESLARLRQRTPGRAADILEHITGTALAPTVLVSGQLDQLVASMQRHGIERTVVIAAPPVAPNDWLLSEARQHEGIIPFVMLPRPLSAHRGVEDWHRALTDLVTRGAAGLKIHPNMDGLSPSHNAYRALFEVAREHALPVILHTGCFHTAAYVHNRPADPTDWAHWFDDYPGVRVCLAHMNRERPEVAWELAGRHDNVYVDTSWQPTDTVRRAFGHMSPDRLLLGSDWPLLHKELQGEALSILQRAVPAAEVRRIGEDNARAFLGLA